MKRLRIVVIIAVALFGCKQKTDPPPEAAGAPEAEPEQVYLGKPLEHWTGLVKKAQTDEEFATAIDALALAIESNDITAVVAAADAVETVGPKAAKAAPALASRLDDPHAWVRMASMHALTAIGEPAVRTLLEVFRTGPVGASVRSVIVLGDMGPEAKSAAAPLRRALEELPEDRHGRIRDALARIEATDAGDASDRTGALRSVVLPPQPSSSADDRDWPQFHGPHRDNVCGETGLRTDWDRNPPELLWRIDGLGVGYSTIAVTDGKVFTMGDRTDGDAGKAQFVLAFDLKTRKELWAAKVGPDHEDGPRSTPTVDGDRLYAVGTEGDLVCLETATGKERWRKSLPNDFGGQLMTRWKFSESVLIDGSKLICTPGGPDATLVALDKNTGEVIWKCAVPALGEKGKDGAGYASAVVAEIDGVRQYVQLIGRGLIGVAAETGKFLWGYNSIANSTANIPTPVLRGRYIFTANNYNAGSALLRISGVADAFDVEELYTLTGRRFENHHGGIVCIGDHVYAGHGNSRGIPTCVDVPTGKILWRGEAPERGSAAVLYADGHLWLRYDRGLIALIEATPEAYRLKGTFRPITGDGPAWAHPVIHDGRLYLRHADLLACYDVRGG